MRKRQQLRQAFAQAEEEAGERREGGTEAGQRKDNDKDAKMEKGGKSINAQEFSENVRCVKASRRK